MLGGVTHRGSNRLPIRQVKCTFLSLDSVVNRLIQYHYATGIVVLEYYPRTTNGTLERTIGKVYISSNHLGTYLDDEGRTRLHRSGTAPERFCFT